MTEKKFTARREPKTVYETKQFLALRREWYGKLSESGFKDIEFHTKTTGEPLPVLNGMSVTDMEKMQTRWGGSKVEYYRLAEHHLRYIQRKFGKKSWQWKAWRIHADGYGTKTISEAVGKIPSQIVKFVNEQKAKIHKDQQNDDVQGYT